MNSLPIWQELSIVMSSEISQPLEVPLSPKPPSSSNDFFNLSSPLLKLMVEHDSSRPDSISNSECDQRPNQPNPIINAHCGRLDSAAFMFCVVLPRFVNPIYDSYS
jgi:hypothetical protein